MLRSNNRAARLAGKVNTTIQQKPLDQLTRAEGEGTGTNIHHNSINDHCHSSVRLRSSLRNKYATRKTYHVPSSGSI